MEVLMHTTRRTIIVAAFTAVAALLAVRAAGQSPSFTTITGEIGPGALYQIAMPTAPWNGELVVFAQGIGNPSAPIALPNLGPLGETLTNQGFAVVYSSRSVNGYGAVKDGMIRTHQLRGIFVETIGQPSRVYLIGRSLGGLISVMLAERFPGQYDGVLSGCGLLDGGAIELKYVADGRVLFDYFFPGVIPGSPFDDPGDFSPGSPTFNAVNAALVQGLSSPDQPTRQFARTANLQAANDTEIVAAGLSVVGFTVIHGNNLLDLTNGHMPYDNSKTSYSGSNDDDALNAGVARFVSDPSAVNYMEHYYTPSGELRIPVLTLHKIRDPLVPILHEEEYAKTVQGAGASQYLLQRTVDGFGHCGFLPAETTAFSALVQWVETGVKPQN
jgi:pimeloyl-ACP methyl ester carboxylesterase